MSFVIGGFLFIDLTTAGLKITEKPQYNESEGTKDFVLYSRGFVIAGTFYYRINYRGT
jgi:hypothetical protein